MNLKEVALYLGLQSWGDMIRPPPLVSGLLLSLCCLDIKMVPSPPPPFPTSQSPHILFLYITPASLFSVKSAPSKAANLWGGALSGTQDLWSTEASAQ